MPKPVPVLDQIAYIITKADAGDPRADGDRYRRFGLAALKPLMKPTGAMIDAAHVAVAFDNLWAINSRADFRKAVKAMMVGAMKGGNL